MYYTLECGVEGNMDLLDFSGIGDSHELMQYTGLKDKNGRDIFESDFVRISIQKNENDPFITHGYYEVVFYEGCFCLKMNEGNYALEKYLHQDSEVIGNIYENPELLEVGERE